MPNTFLYAYGSWRQATNVYVNRAGAWTECKQVWVNQSGTWRLVFQKTFNFTATIPVNTQSYNLLNAVQATGQWDGLSPVLATITCTGIQGATDVNTPAFATGALPAGSILTLTVNSGCAIVGAGGNGGFGGYRTGGSAATRPSTAGIIGGPALNLQCATTIINNGTIGGGGGGGGGGQGSSNGQGYDDPGAGGGGGAGMPFGIGGESGRGPNTGQPGYWGANGTTYTGGANGNLSSSESGEWNTAAKGGSGGNLGVAGVTPGTNTNGVASPAGGAGGAAVIGSGNVTWQVYGTVDGALA